MVSFRQRISRLRRRSKPSTGGIGKPVITRADAPKDKPTDIKKALAGGTTKTTTIRRARSGRSSSSRTSITTKNPEVIKRIPPSTKVNLARQPRFKSDPTIFLKKPPQGTVEAVTRKSGVFLTPLERTRERARALQVEKLRSKPGISIKSLKREGKLAGLTLQQVALETLEGFKQLPKALSSIVLNPKNTIKGAKAIPSKLKQAGTNFGDLLRVSPTQAVARIGSELVLLRVTSRGFETVGKLTSNVAVRVSPKFVGKATTGAKLIVKTSKGKKIIRVVKRIPTESLKKQVKLSGKTTTAISSQADDLVRLIRRRRIIRKPIPGEAKFSITIKRQLKRFDKGKLSSRQAIRLDRQIRKRGAKGILERSFFADPRGRIRPSRLGIKKNSRASIIDILSGDVTFKKARPQILIFPDVTVQKFPKALQKLQNKIKLGKTLTKTEVDELLKFQLKKSGEFKPVGFASREAEITLAPGEIIKRKRVVGKTLVEGRVVNIVEARVVKASKTTKKLLSKGNKGKLNKVELKKLNKLLTKESGFKTSLSSSTKVGKKFLSGRALLGSVSGRISGIKSRTSSSRPRPSPKSSPKSSPRPSPKKSPKPRSSPRPSPKSSPRPSPKKSPKPIIRPKPKPIVKKKKLSPQKRKPIKRKAMQGFNVFGKVKGKFVILNKKPLSKSDALDRMSVSIDRTTGRTGKIKPTGKFNALGKLRKGERGAFKKAKKKFRRFKIRKGKGFKLTNTYIEKKGRPLIDTRGEKRGLTLAKFRKQLGLVKKRKKKVMKKTKRKIKRKVKRRMKLVKERFETATKKTKFPKKSRVVGTRAIKRKRRNKRR